MRNQEQEPNYGAAGLPQELVRGADEAFVEAMEPVVKNANVTLDMATVERIDAAGITALLRLYRSAHDAGHGFHVANTSAHVAKVLHVVGLDDVLSAR